MWIIAYKTKIVNYQVWAASGMKEMYYYLSTMVSIAVTISSYLWNK